MDIGTPTPRNCVPISTTCCRRGERTPGHSCRGDSDGTGFWHEAYFMRGGMEAVYDDMVKGTGFLAFAPASPARGAMFSARGRAARQGLPVAEPPITETDLYSKSNAV